MRVQIITIYFFLEDKNIVGNDGHITTYHAQAQAIFCVIATAQETAAVESTSLRRLLR